MSIMQVNKGGPTKFGVILSTWKQYAYDKDKDGDIDAEDIRMLNEDDARYIAKKVFWDFFQADFILNQSIAEFFVDWGYNSGREELLACSCKAVFSNKLTRVSTLRGLLM